MKASSDSAQTTDNTALFSDFDLVKAIQDAVQAVGYETPSPVQAAAIPILLKGTDLLATAQTGTGKTAAFALPLLSNLDLDHHAPQILVLAPTRELAIQVSEAFGTYSANLPGFKSLAIYGGQSMKTQLDQLRRGVHVVVGTPGRVMDHLRRKTLKLDFLQTVVLDEADEMLRMGFIDDVEWILEHTPDQKQVALFSATMPRQIRKIADNYLNNAEQVSIEPDTKAISAIEQLYWPINRTRKFEALSRLLESEPVDGAVIFVRTKNSTVELADKLEADGFRAAPINGDMNQQLRERTIAKLKSGQIDVLVATDVAARGIDVARVSHVFNYDMPFDSNVYTHRIGRTGRAGRSGKAILFVSQREKRLLRSLERATKSTIEQIELPSPAQIRKLRITHFKDKVFGVDTDELPELFTNVAKEIIEQSDKDLDTTLAALVFLAQQSKPFYSSRKKQDDLPSATKDAGSSDHQQRRKEKRSPRKAEPVMDESGEAVPMETYKIQVGYDHEVSPGDIVGAIANEADISSQYIGRINIADAYSTVDLPEGMPKEVFSHLRKVRVKNRPLNIERFDGNDSRSTQKKPGKKKSGPSRTSKPGRSGDKNSKNAQKNRRKDNDSGENRQRKRR